MTEDDVIRIMQAFISKKFPRKCGACGRRCETFADFSRGTTYVGQPRSYDAEREDWTPEELLGVFSMSNCGCGNTLSMTSEGMDLGLMWTLLECGKTETEKRGIPAGDLLEELRRKVDKKVLEQEEDEGVGVGEGEGEGKPGGR